MEELTERGLAFSELVIEVFRANGLLLATGDELAGPVGLTSARWQVLGVIDHEPITVAGVARTMGLARQSVQQTADSLAADGLIVFQDNPLHRRSRLMTLTSEGRAALAYVERHQAEWANRLGGRLSLADMKITISTLRELGLETRAQEEESPWPTK
ncbi:MarR family winged helix-turn-helix transcriptional regulator [Microtetraspora glauca]|uniref:MarR family transcriptional regulator n=1 Tax=Microtetraspora glauca TaxID=1996 RepID=A0ABV3GRL5_MICGL